MITYRSVIASETKQHLHRTQVQVSPHLTGDCFVANIAPRNDSRGRGQSPGRKYRPHHSLGVKYQKAMAKSNTSTAETHTVGLEMPVVSPTPMMVRNDSALSITA